MTFPTPAGFLRTVFVAIAYFATARLGYALAVGGGMVVMWPPSGLMLGVLAMAPARHWPSVILGGLSGSLASDLMSGYSLQLAVAAALANGIETFAAAMVMKRFLGSPVSFSTLRAVGVLAIGVVCISNAVTAFAGGWMLQAGFGIPSARSWFIWWAGDGLGMLIVAPVLFTWIEAVRKRQWLSPAQSVEAVLALAFLAAAAWIALGPVHAWRVHPGPYFLFPVLLWTAVRFGPIGAATGTLVVAVLAIMHASLGDGPFAIATTVEASAVLETSAFLAVASLSSLIAAAALNERQSAIGQLRQSREQYRNVVETATDAIITIDRRSRIRFANSATEQIFGYPPVELRGQNFSVLMPFEAPASAAPGSNQLLDTGHRRRAWQGTALTGRHKDGREIPLEVSFGQAAEGDRGERTAILRDISEKRAAEHALKTLEEQYRQSQKMEAIGQLAGGIAHDFNNLLTIVQVNCELLLQELGARGAPRGEVEQIYAASQRAASLTRQLLAFSRRQILAPRVVSLSKSIADVEPMLRRLIGEHVVIDIRVAESVGPVMADPGQLEQVILNLAINARDAMPDGGVLTIGLDDVVLDTAEARAADVPPGRYARLAVTDDGVGMDPHTVSRVFEPFFTTKPMGRGTGLGLSTVHGIIKQSGGGIQVDSAPGQGATFHVFLPSVSAPLERLPRTDPGQVAQRRETVLVVEDEADVGRLARRILEQSGYTVLLASSPGEALAIAARESEIGVLLSDVVLPEMSGRALAERMLSTHPDLRVLYMSGYTDDALSRHGVLDRDTVLIEKPFSAQQLIEKLEAVIEKETGSRP